MKRAVLLLLAMATPVLAVDINDTRLLNTPAVSANAMGTAGDRTVRLPSTPVQPWRPACTFIWPSPSRRERPAGRGTRAA